MSLNSRSQPLLHPERPTCVLLILFLLGICLRGTGFYSVALKANPEMWTPVLRGRADAPEQYRIGVVIIADWLARHLPHLTIARAFGLLDLLGSVSAVMLLYSLLRRSETYRLASPTTRWFGSAVFAALVVYIVDWTDWFQKVSTLPSAFLVAAMLWLWTPIRAESRNRLLLRGISLLVVVLLLGFVRADLALFICLGFLAGSVFFHSSTQAMPRVLAVVTSLTGALLSVGVQLYLVKMRYPAATYAGLPAFMLPYDWRQPSMWTLVLIFLAPFLWTAGETAKQNTFGRGPGGALMIGSLAYAALWFCMGRLDEVRIFLPMALAVTPLTVEAIMRKVQGETISSPTS